MLQVSHLNKEYATPRGPLAVLSDVTLALAPGDAAAIMGPSGCGKSTLPLRVGGSGAAFGGRGESGRKGSVCNESFRTGRFPQFPDRLRIPGPLSAAPMLRPRERACANIGAAWEHE